MKRCDMKLVYWYLEISLMNISNRKLDLKLIWFFMHND